MLAKFILPTQPSGSTGGLTAYRWRDSIVFRARARPCKVSSPEHTAVMNIISRLSMDWEYECTGGDRAGWGSYAFSSPLTDKWGNPKYIVGYAQYMRSNRPRIQFGLPRVDVPPIINGFPSYTLPIVKPSGDNSILAIAFNETDEWCGQDGAAMFIWSARPSSPTRKVPTEVYRPVGAILGSTTFPPISPQFFAAPAWNTVNRSSWYMRTSVSMADGRLSGE